MDWLQDTPEQETTHSPTPWKIAIVDDDPEIHKITQLSLKKFEFEQRPLEFIHAYSGKEAKQLLSEHSDVAMVLLDVVMEDNHAGLDVAKYIREDLNNHYSRVILRTGQPGFAPEEQVVQDYDIDGYKSKTEFNVKNLHLMFYTTLRAYRDVVGIQRYQKGLEAVIKAMSNLTELDQVTEFAEALMTQLAIVLNSNQTEFIIQDSEAFALTKDKEHHWHLMANDLGTEFSDQGDITEQSESFMTLAERALKAKQSLFEPPVYAYYHCSKRGTESVFILRNSQTLSDWNQKLLNLFSNNAVRTLENLIHASTAH